MDGGGTTNPQTDGGGVTNQPPVVKAGADLQAKVDEQVTLNGEVSDDGLPGSGLSYLWAKTSGPGTVTFTSPDSLQTGVVFSEAGNYTLSLTANDGEFEQTDSLQVTVTASVVLPTTQDGFTVLEHESGLHLEYDAQTVLSNSTDIDWMYRMWNGIAECQGSGASEVPYPAIRVVNRIPEREASDFSYDESRYLWSYDPARITVLNSDTAIAAGSNQGVALGEAMSVYMGFYANDFFPDPGSRAGQRCQDWHSGGRHDPSPVPAPLPDIEYVHSARVNLVTGPVSIKSDTAAVDEFTLTQIGRLYDKVAQCHVDLGGLRALISEILVLTDRQGDFHGDKWSAGGGFRIADGGRILIDSSDLLDIRSNSEWGFELHNWMNRYMDAYDNNGYVNLECYDLTGIYYDPPLPLDLDE
ncbi:MAG: PKD domain-containing protein [Gammaproteobacteria bacterium]|nr:PKD domain-containing protein [Gammaproteobacteria bacterium]